MFEAPPQKSLEIKKEKSQENPIELLVSTFIQIFKAFAEPFGNKDDDSK